MHFDSVSPSPRILKSNEADAAKHFLHTHITSSMFMLENLEKGGIDYQGKPNQGEYWVSHTPAGKINGLLSHNWNANIMVQVPDEAVLASLLYAFKSQLNRPIAGVLGPDAQVVQVLKTLGLNTRPFACNRTEGLYTIALCDHIPQTMPQTHLAGIDEIDSDLLISWLCAYVIEGLGYTKHAAQKDAIKRVENHKKNKNAWVLMHNDIPVCLCGINAQLPGIVQIGPVWTPPPNRGRGYARVNVSSVLENAMKQGVEQAVLFTDNPAAIKVYRSIGFALSGNYRLALLQSPQTI